MSYAAEMQTMNDNKFYGNALRFNTYAEAEEYAKHKYATWMATVAWQVVESDDPVNYRWGVDGLKALPKPVEAPDAAPLPE